MAIPSISCAGVLVEDDRVSQRQEEADRIWEGMNDGSISVPSFPVIEIPPLDLDLWNIYRVDDDTWSFISSDEPTPYDISGSYSVGTANLEIFDRIVDKIALTNDYLYYRDGQYDYVLVFGRSLQLSGSLFFFNGACNCDYLSHLFVRFFNSYFYSDYSSEF